MRNNSSYKEDQDNIKDAIAFIKELTEENNSLSETVKFRAETIESLQLLITKVGEDNERLTKENERLRVAEERLIVAAKMAGVPFPEGLDIVHNYCEKVIKKTQADTVRKMQSEIKERCIKGGIFPAFVASTIDEIAKEMLEENNGQG